MSPITHALVGWSLALAPGLDRRGRLAVMLAGIAPDLDGVGLVVDLATSNSDQPTELWGAWHHVLGHGLLGAAVVTAACALVAGGSGRARVAALACISFHLHLLGDLVGARGPDGDQWPIAYLWPFSLRASLLWDGQWALNAWPNFAITGALLVLMFAGAHRRGISPLELFSTRASDAFVQTVRRRLGGAK